MTLIFARFAKHVSLAVIGVAVVLSLLGNYAQAQSLAEFMPADVYWTAETSDLPDFDVAWKKTDSYALYCDPAMQPFFDDVRQKRPGLMPHDWLGLRWQEMLDLGAKEVLWGTLPTNHVGGIATVLILKPNGDDFAAKCQAVFEKRWRERGARVGAVKFGETPALGAVTPAKRYGYMFVGPNAIVLCDKSDAMIELIDLQTKKSKAPLSEGKEFKLTQAAAAADSHVHWHVRPFPYWKALSTEDTEKAARQRDRIAFYEGQGFDVIQAIGGGVTFATGEGEAAHQVRVVREGELERGAGLLNLLTDAKFPIPTWLPQSVSSITSFAWDVPKAIKAYGAVYDETYGDGNDGIFEDTLDDIENAEDGPKAKLRTDVLQRMGPLFVVARDWGGEAQEKGTDGKPLKKRRTIWISPSNDLAKSATAFERFYDGDPDFAHENIEVDGKPVKVWISSDPNVLMLGDENNKNGRHLTPQIAAICVVRGYILASSDKEFLLNMLRQGTVPAEQQTTGFFAANKAPANGRYWRNVKPDAEPVFDRIKTNQLDEEYSLEQQILYRLLVAPRQDVKKEWQPVAGEKLPAFSAIEKYFGQLEGTISPAADGWSFRLISRYASPR